MRSWDFLRLSELFNRRALAFRRGIRWPSEPLFHFPISIHTCKHRCSSHMADICQVLRRLPFSRKDMPRRAFFNFLFSFLKHLLNDFHILSIDPGGAPLLTVTPYLPPPPTTDAEFGGWGVPYSSDTSHIELIFITISTFSNHVSFPHSS